MALTSDSTNEVLSVLTYSRPDFRTEVLDLIPYGISDNYLSPPTRSLGTLGVLPIELFDLIFRSADLRAVASFQLVNKRARIIVRSSIPYKYLLLHSPSALCALTRSTAYFTVGQLYNVLCSSTCSVCNQFGGFIWLPACKRCCMPCLRESPQLRPITQRESMAALGLRRRALPDDPGTSHIGLGERPLRNALHQKSGYRTVGTPSTQQSAVNFTGGSSVQFSSATFLPYLDRSTGTLHYGVSCRGCDCAYQTAMNDPDVSYVERMALFRRRDLTYSLDGFLFHLETCSEGKTLWSRSDA
ncbi:uncharacterized protein BT62DRAFT_729157 [Guyanagaster necrorhizus]|uniref:F-box domain-containing protein n=1 Tax=Guyanagaster necrorhizus TaxID=856835 RepID=A0A9P7VYX7_9AGAR|nr:uncharacterized protein BT62DRAFT_729157 [Guyanagaster necrorhizus MCA 3950]KAG7448814.1 hypothetical protein BT62DRAFT_729157 [Guyanagaster necrorhizus MCA 3950]